MPGRHQSGLSLIEVLITVVLVSIGLLGLAGLQLTSVRNSNSSGERFIATTLAQDILDRMRANRSNAADYALAMAANPAAGAVAGDDLDIWMDTLQATLPDGDGSIEVDDDNLVTVTVQWTDAVDRSLMDLELSTTL
ncbi:MAG: type IV pilus modification protein PilV [Gammaproteobacteria bacterium]|jgi:type IV pilus assembly protein PilV|nr:type IV pilus modification protein PilV [Gammaproteobacteria bacterium]